MSVRKEHLKGVPRKMLRLRLRIKGITGPLGAGRESVKGVRRSEPVDSMIHRLRLDYS